jgi:hypothetical protein
VRESDITPVPVKLFAGMFSPHTLLFEEIRKVLEGVYGPVDMESPVWPWEHTDYYTEEMGRELKRKFFFFRRLINPAFISDIKLQTVQLEKEYLNKDGGRRINIDPGYMDSARVALVSTDDYSHRVYLGKGIYGEVTLIYSGSDYRILPYTYPDFRKRDYHDIFKKARILYQKELKERGCINLTTQVKRDKGM